MMPGRCDRMISREVTFAPGPVLVNCVAEAMAAGATVHSVMTLSTMESTPSSKSAGALPGSSLVNT